MKYYPARLAGTYRSSIDALQSVGFTAQQVDALVNKASVNQSESVFAVVGEGKGVVACKLPNGTVGLWQACIDLLCDTPAKAQRYARKIDAGLGSMKGSTWAVFE